MSVEVTNETAWQIDGKIFSDLGVWVMSQMRVSTQSDLTIMFVDPDPIAQLHMRWMSRRAGDASRRHAGCARRMGPRTRGRRQNGQMTA